MFDGHGYCDGGENQQYAGNDFIAVIRDDNWRVAFIGTGDQ